MKMIRTFFAIFIAFAFLFVSCEEIETSDLTIDLSKEATVKAFVYAELNNTTQGLEYAPNGTQVIVSIPNSSFNSSASGLWIDTTIVNNGMIQLNVPATDAGVTVSLIPAEFTYDQVQAFGQNSTTIAKLYKLSGTSSIANVKPGQIRTHEITYDDISSFDNFTEKVSIVFELYAVTNESAGSQYVPSGTVITIYNDNFSTTATVGAAGVLNVSAPKSETVTLRFETTKTLVGPPVETKNYRYQTNHSAPSTSSPVKVTLNFSGGSLWQ